MKDTNDILLHMIELNWTNARQAEDQRSTITGLIIIIASAIQGGLTQTGFSKNALPITLMLIVLGAFGMLASAKLYERFQLNVAMAVNIRKRLEELHPDIQIKKIVDKTEAEHLAMHPILGEKVRLHRVWQGLHALIVILGITYKIIILVR
jgi:hypothetical protein